MDAHVHFHRMELVAPTLDSAARNFSMFERPASAVTGVLLLAESARERIFDRLRGVGMLGDWQFRESPGEPVTILAEARDRRIAIVCGRQIRCALGLEVLALGTMATYPEGLELEETLDRVTADGAVASVPWGFGKWIGRAGAQVAGFFSRGPRVRVFAGDNGGRLDVTGQPGLLDSARRAGFEVLPGTDPFPFSSDYRRVGSFGFLADVEPPAPAPWAALREWLEDQRQSPQAYGRALGPLRFAFNQCWIQVHNRMLTRQAG